MSVIEYLFTGYRWTLFVFLFYVFSAYTSIKINDGSTKWFWINYAVGLLPLWGLVARYSTSLVFDGMVYDGVMTVTYLIAICIMTGSFQKMSITSIVGIFVVLFGLLMVKLGQR